MYSVLLIDDESWVMEDLKLLVDWRELGFEIVAEAFDAESARKAIEEHSPDLVISDIRMPGLSGIQLLEEYPVETRTFKALFVTAYGKFEYAKRALELGAFGYLLKPVEPNELSSTLVKIKEVLDAEQGISRQIDLYEKAKIVYSLLDSYNSKEEIENKLKKIGITDTSKRFILVLVKCNMENFTKKLAVSRWNIVVIPLSNRRCLLFIQSKSGSLNLTGYKSIIKYLVDVYNEEDNVIGISDVFSDFSKFKTAFLQAECALDTYFINEFAVNLYHDGTNELENVYKFISDFGTSNSILILLEELPSVLVKNKTSIWNLNEVISYLIKHLGIEIEGIETDTNVIVTQFPNLRTYLSYLYQYTNGAYKKTGGKTSSRYIIREITDYINNNYYEKLMINDLAQRFFLNPSYLSGLFKEETGKAFTTYLVECRLKKAVELLENTTLSSAEISSRVGYDDYFHFSKLFKKHIGVSPSNYRKNMRIEAIEELEDFE